MTILNVEKLVPMMFQAQIKGRCQLQYARSGDAQKWADQWTDYGAIGEYEFGPNVQTKTYQISWRFVTNGGQDDGIIRPVIGADGLPFYPGSSMKGAFRQACELEEKAGNLRSGTCSKYCGSEEDLEPGILRFHGGYPPNNWKQELLDLVHPQPGWQVKETLTTKKTKGETAHPLISLYQPQLKFGISSIKLDIDWEQVWQIWEKALGYGIGCRVSSGYGLTQAALDNGKITHQVEVQGEVLDQVKLRGQGSASQNFQRHSEFRPNMFRATLRSHALRIFGGLNPSLAEDIVDDLFGGIRPHQEKVGLLRVVFVPDSSDVLVFDEKHETAYEVTGNLIWTLFPELTQEDQKKINECLKNLVKKLTQFAMLLGGFGKSWRRADHKIFYPEYKDHSIGCHWQWVNSDDNPIQVLNNEKEVLQEAAKLIQETVFAVQEWINLRFSNSQISASNSQQSCQLTSQEKRMEKLGVILKSVQEKRKLQPAKTQDWREAWHKDNVQVWGRIAKNKGDSQVIPWLHDSQRTRSQNQGRKSNNSSASHSHVNPAALARPNNKLSQSTPPIYRTCLTGRVQDTSKSDEPTAIGRLWHRMYPLDDERYLELITIFPTGCDVAKSFVTWLNSSRSTFVKLQWYNQGTD